MRDLDRLSLGIIGTIGAWTLEDFAQLASIAAGVATAVFMGLSAMEKIKNWLKK